MHNFYQTVSDRLFRGETVAFATIFENVGSSPRHAGAKMAIYRDGTIFGTIGGGKLEAMAIEAAKEALVSGFGSRRHFDLTNEDAAASDMICGGYGDILISVLDGNEPAVRDVFAAAARSESANEPGWLVTRCAGDGRADQFCFIDAEGTKIAPFSGTDFDLASLRGTPGRISVHSSVLERDDIFLEAISPAIRVFVFGGGHVAKETVLLLNLASFRTIVIDDRAEFVSSERFPNSERHLVETYRDLSRFHVAARDCIVILTRGHLGDYDVLKWALTTDAPYIGMIGSTTKRERIYERLRGEGVSDAQLNRVTSPIGIPIAGETPFEIAVSIAAQLIDFRGTNL